MPVRRPVGSITRGTTNPNRLRRNDRWLAGPQAWRLRLTQAAPVVVDLGYGASPATVIELAARLRRVRPDLRMTGIEIDPERVHFARDRCAQLGIDEIDWQIGGFEIPIPGRVTLVRAFNVLRQYPEGQVSAAWPTVQERLEPHGLLVDGTCDELGRHAAWVAIDRDGPQSLTLSWRLKELHSPAIVAQRLPKVLIHRNVPGERIHEFMNSLEQQWNRSAQQSSYGQRQRFLAMVQGLQAQGWPVTGGRARWRLGELTLPWGAVAPRSGPAAQQPMVAR